MFGPEAVLHSTRPVASLAYHLQRIANDGRVDPQTRLHNGIAHRPGRRNQTANFGGEDHPQRAARRNSFDRCALAGRSIVENRLEAPVLRRPIAQAPVLLLFPLRFPERE
jgi:hypothetical protein